MCNDRILLCQRDKLYCFYSFGKVVYEKKKKRLFHDLEK